MQVHSRARNTERGRQSGYREGHRERQTHHTSCISNSRHALMIDSRTPAGICPAQYACKMCMRNIVNMYVKYPWIYVRLYIYILYGAVTASAATGYCSAGSASTCNDQGASVSNDCKMTGEDTESHFCGVIRCVYNYPVIFLAGNSESLLRFFTISGRAQIFFTESLQTHCKSLSQMTVR